MVQLVQPGRKWTKVSTQDSSSNQVLERNHTSAYNLIESVAIGIVDLCRNLVVRFRVLNLSAFVGLLNCLMNLTVDSASTIRSNLDTFVSEVLESLVEEIVRSLGVKIGENAVGDLRV